jgi:hypothetical protein
VPGIGFIHRKLPTADIYFVVNSSNYLSAAGMIQFRSNRQVTEEWDPDTAKVLRRLPGDKCFLVLGPYESRVFVLSDANQATSEFTPPPPALTSKTVDMSASWQIRFPDTPAQPIAPLVSWTDLPNRQYFSGEAVYTSTFTLNPDDAQSDVFLDFGSGTPTIDARPPNASGIHALLDPPIREAAIIFINGTRVGSLWHPPYKLNITSALHPGENTIEVHVFNTAINLLAGQPPRDYTALRARFGHRFDPQDMDNLHPIPSGLLGPVTLDTFTSK